MKPIDGAKLEKWLEKFYKDQEPMKREYFSRYDAATDAIDIIMQEIEKPEYQLPFLSGTLVIPRDEGFEKRDCNTCICRHLDCRQVREKGSDCEFHVDDIDLDNAIIIGK